jgi:hypothetical protein
MMTTMKMTIRMQTSIRSTSRKKVLMARKADHVAGKDLAVAADQAVAG